MTVIHKVTVAKAAGGDALEFVLSDKTKDRYGDVIDPKGWVLANFKKNPIALFNHSSNFPIGFWRNVRVEGDRLIGKLQLAAKGTSDRIDEIISLVEQGILRAVSVGFQPIKREALADNSGILFTEQELLETSLVSVPANPSAVQLARSLNISDDTMAIVFGKNADMKTRSIESRGATGEHASKSQTGKSGAMKPISKQIEEKQTLLVGLQDQLVEKTAGLDTAEDVEAANAEVTALNDQIEATQKSLDVLRRVERNIAEQAPQTVVVRDGASGGDDRRPWAAPAKQLKPFDHLVRAITVMALSRAHTRDPLSVMKERYGEDRLTKGTFDVINRAASAPAMTTTTGWAAELVQTAFLDIIETLMPQSVYPRLSGIGGRFTFGQNGVVSIPARSTATTIAGSFVGQGSPIPVRQGAFTATTLTPKKMGVITAFTREMAEHSTPQIEGYLREAIVEDTAVALDSVLLDATAASSVRPAGIRNGVVGASATSGGGLTAVVGDIKLLATTLISGSNGMLRKPVWIMNPANVLSLSLIVNSQGEFVFENELANGTFRGYPLLQSTTVPAGTIVLLDAADFFSATGDVPVFTASDQATLHMEDTTPLAIGTAGTPTTVAAPVRSLFQTDSIAIRMTMDVNWAFRRTGTVAFVSSITW